MSGYDPEAGAAAHQRLQLEFSQPPSSQLLETLGALASEHGFTIRDVSGRPLPSAQTEQAPAPPPHQSTARLRNPAVDAQPAPETVLEELPEPLQGWWELDKATHRKLYGPITEVIQGDFRVRVAQIGATSLVHLLSFGRGAADWTDRRALNSKTRRQFMDHIDEISPYPWREAPTLQDLARMCRTPDDVWAACLLVFDRSGHRIERLLGGTPPNAFGRQTFVRHNSSAVSFGDIVRSPTILSMLLENANRKQDLPELQARMQGISRAFVALQLAVDAPIPGLGQRPPSSAKE